MINWSRREWYCWWCYRKELDYYLRRC
jgi:hypothetical protein